MKLTTALLALGLGLGLSAPIAAQCSRNCGALPTGVIRQCPCADPDDGFCIYITRPARVGSWLMVQGDNTGNGTTSLFVLLGLPANLPLPVEFVTCGRSRPDRIPAVCLCPVQSLVSPFENFVN